MSLHDGSRWTAREVRDRATEAFARNDDLTLPEWSAYLILDSYANGAPECWPSITRILSHVPASRMEAFLRSLTGLYLHALPELAHVFANLLYVGDNGWAQSLGTLIVSEKLISLWKLGEWRAT